MPPRDRFAEEMEAWKTLDSRYVVETPWMKVREDRVRLPGVAEPDVFHVVEYPDWACVLCFADDGRLVMVEQYRHGLGRTCLGLPAGVIDAGETPLAGARRELREETGYEAEDWAPLGACAPNPSKQPNTAFVFVARAARRVDDQRLDHMEDIRVRLLEPRDVLRRAEAGDIVHGIHLMAVFWARHRDLL